MIVSGLYLRVKNFKTAQCIARLGKMSRPCSQLNSKAVRDKAECEVVAGWKTCVRSLRLNAFGGLTTRKLKTHGIGYVRNGMSVIRLYPNFKKFAFYSRLLALRKGTLRGEKTTENDKKPTKVTIQTTKLLSTLLSCHYREKKHFPPYRTGWCVRQIIPCTYKFTESPKSGR